MPSWDWLALAANVVVWSIFFYLLTRRRWNVAALTVGVLHMLFAVVVSVAPFRAVLDPKYVGLGLGFLRFEHVAASFAATLIFCWAVAAAWCAVAKGRGRSMLLLMIGDALLALNFGGSTLFSGDTDSWRIDFGEGRSITGLTGAAIMLLLFTAPFIASALWAARRRRSNGSAPPLASDLTEKREEPENPKGSGGFRFAASRL